MTDIRGYNKTYDCFIVDPRYKYRAELIIGSPESDKVVEVDVKLCDVVLSEGEHEALRGDGGYALWKGFFTAFRCATGAMDHVRKEDYDAAIEYWARHFKPVLVYYWGSYSPGFWGRFGMCRWVFKGNDTAVTEEEAVRVAWNYIHNHRSNEKWMCK